jgi:hypothetical protein
MIGKAYAHASRLSAGRCDLAIGTALLIVTRGVVADDRPISQRRA